MEKQIKLATNRGKLKREDMLIIAKYLDSKGIIKVRNINKKARSMEWKLTKKFQDKMVTHVGNTILDISINQSSDMPLDVIVSSSIVRCLGKELKKKPEDGVIVATTIFFGQSTLFKSLFLRAADMQHEIEHYEKASGDTPKYYM